MKSKAWNMKEYKRMLARNGYYPVRQTGSHIIYENNIGDTIAVKCNKINKMIARRMIKEHNLKVD